jgi:proline iminopeptidase
MPPMDPAALAEIKRLEAEGRTTDPRYEELLLEHHYVQHVCRLPLEDWPEPVTRSFAHINHDIYAPMQGPSELGASGRLLHWDRTAELRRIDVPTLVMGATHDTMDPAHLEWMAGQLPQGRYHHCPDGSHLAIVDDQETYFAGLIGFLRDVDAAS